MNTYLQTDEAIFAALSSITYCFQNLDGGWLLYTDVLNETQKPQTFPVQDSCVPAFQAWLTAQLESGAILEFTASHFIVLKKITSFYIDLRDTGEMRRLKLFFGNGAYANIVPNTDGSVKFSRPYDELVSALTS